MVYHFKTEHPNKIENKTNNILDSEDEIGLDKLFQKVDLNLKNSEKKSTKKDNNVLQDLTYQEKEFLEKIDPICKKHIEDNLSKEKNSDNKK